MRPLKSCILSLALLPIISTSYAETTQTGKTNCKDFAAQQLKEVKQDYYGTLTRDEASLALQVAERSCLTLQGELEEERTAIRAKAEADYNKPHLWERMELEGKEAPGIRKAQLKGGK